MPIVASILYAALALAGIGINLLEAPPLPGAVKALPLLLLSGIAWAYTRQRYRYWIIAAALFGAMGDFFLATAERAWLIPGLVVFLLGHIAYGVAFARERVWSRARLTVIAAATVPTLALLAGVCIRLVRAEELGLIAPVLVYVAVMIGMMAIAVLHRCNTPLIAAGAIVFILSDAHIAVNHMLLASPLLPITLSGYTSYYLAQYLIISGAVAASRQIGATAQ